MDRLSSLQLAVMAAVCVAATSAASGRSSNALTSGGVLTGCIDDSDCQKLGEGSKYACFLVRILAREGREEGQMGPQLTCKKA